METACIFRAGGSWHASRLPAAPIAGLELRPRLRVELQVPQHLSQPAPVAPALEEQAQSLVSWFHPLLCHSALRVFPGTQQTPPPGPVRIGALDVLGQLDKLVR